MVETWLFNTDVATFSVQLLSSDKFLHSSRSLSSESCCVGIGIFDHKSPSFSLIDSCSSVLVRLNVFLFLDHFRPILSSVFRLYIATITLTLHLFLLFCLFMLMSSLTFFITLFSNRLFIFSHSLNSMVLFHWFLLITLENKFPKNFNTGNVKSDLD